MERLMALIINTTLLILMAAGCFAGCSEPEPHDPIPQERCDWPNPAGYGLQLETEAYSGLVY